MDRPVIPASGINLREAVATEFQDVARLVRGALTPVVYPGNPNGYVDIEALFADRVVVCRDGRYFSYPYTINEQNQVVFGNPIEVVETFEPVGKGAAAAPAAPGGGVFVEAVGEASKGRWLIRVIKSGLSYNNVFYSDAVLREAAPLFEGVRVFNKSDAEHIKGEGKKYLN